MVNCKQIEKMTIEYGGQWGISHVRRLLKLIDLISGNKDYDKEVIWIATHLHDWGAYPNWKIKEMDHAARSKEIASEYLADKALSDEKLLLILECIEFHHSKFPNRCIESILLSDADALDFLGSIGLFRVFSKQTKDLRKAHNIIKQKIISCKETLQLEKSKKIAEDRISRMNAILKQFEKDSFGFF